MSESQVSIDLALDLSRQKNVSVALAKVDETLADLMEEATEEQEGEQVSGGYGGWPENVKLMKARGWRRRRDTVLRDQQESEDRVWMEIFLLQHSDGYWEPTPKLGELIKVNFHLFVDVFLQRKGIRSLGEKAHADIVRLVATLLVLQFMRLKKLEEGKLLRTLFSLEEPTLFRPSRWQAVKRAVDWARWADRQYPSIYSRLEFGFSWDSSTRQLLGYESVSSSSPLSGLNLQGGFGATAVH